MKTQIATILMCMLAFSSAAHAGFWSRFCERHIIAPYPWPYEDSDFKSLVRDYLLKGDPQMLAEINGRLTTNAVTAEELEFYRRNFPQ